MEKIKKFLRIETGDGDGDGSGYGYGSGYGSGSGDGSGYGDGDGDGYGYGYGYGYGDGSGDGYGYGYGYGDGSGYGYGYGDGSGDGSGISTFNGQRVYQVDGVPTIISKVRGNIAKGFILCDDFTLSPCYIAKGHNKFAHGKTLKMAVEDLENKIFEDMDPEEAIRLFLQEFSDPDKKYPAKAFWVWHNRLTGSCEMGRNNFVRNGGYDLENDTFSVQEFIDITKNAYGGNVIQKLENALHQTLETED